jgi:hypothetical protein
MLDENKMIKRSWIALDGCLIFDITINNDPGNDIPSCAKVFCRSNSADSRLLTITQLWPVKPFEFKYRSGCYVSGYLQQKAPVHIDGFTATAIFADIHYGVNGQGDDHHFEGLMVVCPMTMPTPDSIPPKPQAPIEPDR